MLKRLGAGGVALGAIPGLSSADVSTCESWVIVGMDGWTDYTIEFQDGYEVDPGLYFDDADTIDGNRVEGSVYEGYEDGLNLASGAAIQYLRIDGDAIVAYTADSCGNSYGLTGDNKEIDISGYGDYTVGYWDTLEEEGNVDSSEFETVSPTFSNTGDPQVTVVSDVEGVVSGEVTANGNTFDTNFATGQLSGGEDSYETGDNAYGVSAARLNSTAGDNGSQIEVHVRSA
jgi:hypothetical protein